MAIKKISVSNFKSFNELEIELGNLNILIGANASGKSNFLQIFRFLKDITNYGLENAISLQGGIEYLRNTRISSAKNFSLGITYAPKSNLRKWETPLKIGGRNPKKPIARYFYESIYKFTLEFLKDGTKFRIIEDKLIRKLKLCEFEKIQKAVEGKELGSGVMIFSKVEGNLEYEFIPETRTPEVEDAFAQLSDMSALIGVEKLPPEVLFMETSLFDVINPFEKSFHHIPIYDFDPRLPKKAVPITGKTTLEEDGSNLAIVLKNILGDPEQKRKFSNLIKYLLPFINDLRVEKFADKSLLFTLQETYNQDLHLPASFLSDGTINITALIIALYFEERPSIIIEEPEKNVHPSLISKIVTMFEEVSAQKQILVTTHNPEVVKYVDLENILLITRDEEGFSTISRPSEKKEVKTFLENEIGIEELYIQDLLGV